MVDAVAPAPSRRLPLWVIIAAPTACVLTGVFVLLWFKLPTWAPEWVVEHSPWVDPIVRAVEEDEDQMADAVAVIAHGGAARIPAMRAYLTHPTLVVRRVAARVLGEFRDPVATEALLIGLDDPDEDMVKDTIKALGQTGDRRALTAMVEFLDREPPQASTGESGKWLGALMMALATLPRFSHRDVAEVILPLPEEYSHRAGWRFELAGKVSDERVVKALARALYESENFGWQDKLGGRGGAAARALAYLSHPDALTVFQHAFASDSAVVRSHAIKGIMFQSGGLVDPQLIHLVLRSLDDQNDEVRSTAATAFSMLNHPPAEPRLLELSRDTNTKVRIGAMFGLGTKGASESAIQRMGEGLSDPEAEVQSSALGGLRRTKNPLAVKHLIDAFANLEGRQRTMCVLILSTKPFDQDEQVFPFMLVLAKHPEAEIRSEALETLGRLAVTEAQLKEVETVRSWKGAPGQ